MKRFGYMLALMLPMMAINLIAAEPEVIPGAERFNPQSEATGTGWIQVYDPVSNTVDTLNYEAIDGTAIYQGDMVLGPVSDLDGLYGSGNGSQNSVARTNLGSRWDDGILVYDMNGHPDEATILNVMAGIEAATPIRFVARTNENSYVKVIAGSGCSSWVGKTGGSQNLTLQTPGCLSYGTIAHEFYHALGFQHEQSRSDRDTYVEIHLANILSGKESNFDIANVGSHMDIGPYDYDSMMHYGRRAFSSNGQDTITTIPPGISIGQRSGLSPGDIAGMLRAYFADLELDLATVSNASAGQAVQATITVSNLRNSSIGSIIAMDAVVSLAVPTGSTYVGYSSADNWNCQQTGQNLDCSMDILDRDADSVLVLDFTAPVSSGNMQLDATVTAANYDPATSNNTDSATISVNSSLPGVTITSPASGSTVTEGDMVTFGGSATDAEDGDLSAGIAWSSDIDGDFGNGSSVSIATLSIGVHTITASVSDTDGNPADASIVLTVEAPPNTPPVIAISSPSSGSTITEGDSVTFAGSATDAEDGNLNSDIEWSSNIDGSIGNGSSTSTTTLSVGVHTITASVTDSDSNTETATIALTVEAPPNTPPVVSISSPSNGSSFTEGDTITFVGSATDAEDGSLDADIAWSSDRDGNLGNGSSIALATLSDGVHTITASVADSQNETSTASISLTVVDVPNTDPVISISAPGNGSSFFELNPVTFTGTATDAEDGTLSGNIAWSSSIDGALGNGASISVTTLSVGAHTITAGIADTEGATATASVSITIVVAPPNTAPVVAISSPGDGSSFTEGAPVTINGNATDAEDGNISANIAWSSSVDGALGNGANLNVNTLSVGTHTITANVSDSAGASALDSVTITVTAPPPNTAPVVTISSPGDGSAYTVGDSITIAGDALDGEDGDISNSIGWTSSLDGDLGNGASISISTLSVGTHTVTATIADNDGAVGTASVSVTVDDAGPPPNPFGPVIGGGGGTGLPLLMILALGGLVRRWLAPGSRRSTGLALSQPKKSKIGSS